MALREGNRQQMEMMPPSIEQYIPDDTPVRVYDAFVEAMDLKDLGIDINPSKEGNPCYDPRAMLKLLVYGYSYGVRSSRKLEREAHYNLTFIWLMGGLRPDHKTIAEFRRRHKEALKKALGQCVNMCMKLDLIAGNILFVDGSKIRANASIKNTWSVEKCRKVLRKAERRIEEIISESEAIDKEEEGMPSLVSVNKELANAQVLKERISQIMEELRESGKPVVNTVDKECTRTNSVQGTHAGYNAQVVVDDGNGLIVSCDAVDANNDIGQFSRQIDQAQEALGQKCAVAVADSGYAWTDDLAKVDKQGIRVIVPTQRIVSQRAPGEFDKENFRYDRDRDCYICPQGAILRYGGVARKSYSRAYVIENRETCRACSKFGRCTTACRGRKVLRLVEEDLRSRLEREYGLSQNQAIYKRRGEKVELVFGHMKRNLGVTSFLMRGRSAVRAELSLLSVCFNLRRMMTLLGVEGLIRALRRVSPVPVIPQTHTFPNNYRPQPVTNNQIRRFGALTLSPAFS